MATPQKKRKRRRAPSETSATTRSETVPAWSEEPAITTPSIPLAAISAAHLTSTALAAAEREVAIERLREPVAYNAVTAEQQAELQYRLATDPTFADALNRAAQETVDRAREQQTLIEHQVLLEQQAPFEQQGPFLQHAPLEQQPSYQQQSPFEQQNQYQQQSPFEQQAAFQQQAPFQQQALFEQQVPNEQLAIMMITRNIRTDQSSLIHWSRMRNPDFKRDLDELIAAYENDPAVLAEKERVMAWRLEDERQRHEQVWAMWQAENAENARRAAALRARALEVARARGGRQ